MEMEPTNASGVKVLREGKFATVLLSLSNRKGRGYRECSAVKVFRGESEDDTARRLAKEAFFMRMTAPYNHRNIVEEVNWAPEDCSFPTPRNSIRLDYAPLSLAQLMRNPPVLDHWLPIGRSFAFQLCSGLYFLHHLGIAHRDINPENLMIDWLGHLKIIDFSSACLVESAVPDQQRYVLESPGRENMDYQVGTGPYRAPELLFASTTYDAYAVDIWAMGVVIAEFFSPAIQTKLGAQSGEQDGQTVHIDISSLSLEDTSSSHPARDTLFDASFGDLGLAASIFRLRGLPTDETWPKFYELPDAGKFQFDITPESIEARMPLLNRIEPRLKMPALQFIDHLLRLQPSQRMPLSAAIDHEWFRERPLVLLPATSAYPIGHRVTAEKWRHLRPRNDFVSLHMTLIWGATRMDQMLASCLEEVKKELDDLSQTMDASPFIPKRMTWSQWTTSYDCGRW